MGLDARNPVFGGLRTTKGQTSLISTFVFSLIEKYHIKTCYELFSSFWLVSVAEQAGLNLTLSETPKTGFLTSRPICRIILSLKSTIPKLLGN